MELTQDYLDKQLKMLATKEDIKAAFESQTKDLKSYADQQTETLARIIASTVADPMERHFTDLKDLLQIKEIVERHEREIERLKALLSAA